MRSNDEFWVLQVGYKCWGKCLWKNRGERENHPMKTDTATGRYGDIPRNTGVTQTVKGGKVWFLESWQPWEIKTLVLLEAYAAA